MMSDGILGGGNINGRLVLPHPFHHLESVWDSRAKGSWILVNISNNFEVSVLKCKPGVQLLSSKNYNSHNSITLIQCPNVTKKSVGFVAIGIEKERQSINNEFTTLQDGILHRKTFLCIVQGIFLSPSGELSYIFHKLRPFSTIQTSLTQLISKYVDDQTTFCKIVFEHQPTTALDSSISFLYLNQITGPRMEACDAHNNVNVERGVPFIQARMQPDSWCNEWLSDDNHLRRCIKFEAVKERNNKCELKTSRGKSRRSKSNGNVGMQRLCRRTDDMTDVYYCVPRLPLVEGPDSKFQLVEYITETSNKTIFVGAPLKKNEIEIFDSIYQQHTHLSTTEHNALLNSLLKKSGRSKMACFIVTPGDSNTEQVAIVLLPQGSDFPSDNSITKLSSRVSKTTASGLKDGAIEIDYGFPIQWIYSWPFEKVMTLDHLSALQQAYPHPRTIRTNAECCHGYYQNFGPRSTNQASGSLVAAPNMTSEHHHYHEGFNKSTTPLFTNIRNGLRDEAKQATTHLGQPFIHACMKLRGVTEFFDVIGGSLITYGGYTNLIHQDRRDHYLSIESKNIKSLIREQKDSRYPRYVDNFEKVFGEAENVPTETTCCWCLLNSDYEYIHQQFFVNVTASIAMNLSSNAFSDTINQFGSTFFGSLFEHCSSRPLWIRDDGMIRVTPPEGTKFYNFAWGDHVANRKQKRDAERATIERNRRHEKYTANRDRALNERNFNTQE